MYEVHIPFICFTVTDIQKLHISFLIQEFNDQESSNNRLNFKGNNFHWALSLSIVNIPSQVF